MRWSMRLTRYAARPPRTHMGPKALSAPFAPGSIPSSMARSWMEALDMMKQRGTYYVPTLMALVGFKEGLERGAYAPEVAVKGRAAAVALDTTVRKAFAKGVKIALGTHAAVYDHGRNGSEFGEPGALGHEPPP